MPWGRAQRILLKYSLDMKYDRLTIFAIATVPRGSLKLDGTYLESVASVTDSDACILRQILGVVGEIFRSPASYCRLTDTHVGNQYGFTFSHSDTTYARHSVHTSRTRPVLHLHLQDYNK